MKMQEVITEAIGRKHVAEGGSSDRGERASDEALEREGTKSIIASKKVLHMTHATASLQRNLQAITL